MKTLKLFYAPFFFKPVFSSMEYEIGDTSVVTNRDGKKIKEYLIGQEIMTEAQSELFFYLWDKRKKRASFDEIIKYAIKLAIKVSVIDEADDVLKTLIEEARIKREKRRNESLNRAYRKLVGELISYYC